MKRKAKPAPQYLTEAEVTAFFAAISDPRDRALFTVAYYRGLRASELYLIRRHDVDLDASSISVRRLKGSDGGRYELTEMEISALKAWFSAEKPCQDGSGRVFDLKRGQIFNLFRRYATAAGIRPEMRHPHVLKHSIATHLLSRDLDIIDVKDWLGHVDLRNTLRYAKVTNARRHSAAAKFRNSLKP